VGLNRNEMKWHGAYGARACNMSNTLPSTLASELDLSVIRIGVETILR
jgi:hypothetical protein